MPCEAPQERSGAPYAIMENSLLDTGLAFLEGLALIAIPCILPVLPLMLSTSATGGKDRPYGIIAGFVLSFSVFVLASRWIVQALHIDLDLIKYVSLGLLFLLGLVMLSEKLSQKFAGLTQGFGRYRIARRGAGLPRRACDRRPHWFGVDALRGADFGRCAGGSDPPANQPAKHRRDFFLRARRRRADADHHPTGRTVMNRLRFLTTHAEIVRKIFGVLILASVVWLALGATAVATFDAGAPLAASAQSGLQDGVERPYAAPELAGIDDWINSEPLTIAQLRGKVVLIDFWTYSCINCVRTLPYLIAWDKKYREKGLVIIGVHSPEFEFEKKIDNIKTAVAKYGITYPVAVDSELATWTAFDNQYWPAHYLIDKNGQVVYTHFGEGHYDITENNIRYLLGLKGPAETDVASNGELSGFGQTPETYLGYARAERFVGGALQPEIIAGYQSRLSWASINGRSAAAGMWRRKKLLPKAPAPYCGSISRRAKFFSSWAPPMASRARSRSRSNGGPPGAEAGKDVEGGVVNIGGHAPV